MPNSYAPIRVIIADDQELLREGLRVLLRKVPDIEVVDEASDGDELVELTRKHQPDVVITDVKMVRMGGPEATRIIKKEFPHIGVVALSMYDDEYLIVDMITAGAKGYLLKNTNTNELAEAIKAAYHEQPYYGNQKDERVALMIARGGEYNNSNDAPPVFTSREMDVIQKICEGYSSKQIAGMFGLATRSVERYRDAIMLKMKVHNSAAVVAYAISHGLFKSNEEK